MNYDLKTLSALREQAEEKLRQQSARLEKLSRRDIRDLVHELGTYQIELEMQNEELRRAQEDLEVSRRKYLDLYDFAPLGYFTFDNKGLIREVNLNGAGMLGFDRRFLINRSFFQFVEKRDWEVFRSHLDGIPANEVSQTCEIRLKRKGGHSVYVQLRSILVEDAGIDSPCCRTAVIDITERKQAEDFTHHLASFPLKNPNPVLEISSHGAVVFRNAAAQEVIDSIGTDSANVALFLPSDIDVILRDLAKKKEKSIYREVAIEDRVFAETVYIAPQFKVARIYSFEITEQHRAKEKLKKSEEKFRLIADTSVDLIFQLDISGNITYCSPAIAHFGYKPEDIIDRDFRSFIASDDISRAESAFKQALSGRHVKDLILQVSAADGTLFYSEINIVPMKERGVVAGFQGILRDITRRKKAEEDLRKAKEDLELRVRERTAELTAANRKLRKEITVRKAAERQLRVSREKLQKLSGHLIAVREQERISIAREVHDELGQILTAIGMDISQLKKRYKDHTALMEVLHSLSNLVETAINTVHDITSKLRPRQLDHLGLIPAIEWQSKELARKTGLSCNVEVPVEFPPLDHETSTTLFRVFQEAITNAVRHACPTRINVSLKISRGTILLKVADNGKGMASRRLSGMNSFGIMGMRERTKQIGGSITFRSMKDRGTTVTVKIPLTK